jgi:hypothetical protein
MKLTIDTREDSPADIRKAIQMLQGLVGNSEEKPAKNIFEDNTSTDTPFFGNIFDDSKPAGDKNKSDDSGEKIEIVY